MSIITTTAVAEVSVSHVNMAAIVVKDYGMAPVEFEVTAAGAANLIKALSDALVGMARFEANHENRPTITLRK